MNLTQEQIELLNTKEGIKHLFSKSKIDLQNAIKNTDYAIKLRQLQIELVGLQQWVESNNKKVIVLFEGRDAAGKGGAIRRITARINPRYFRIEALPMPTEEEQKQWYFQRYVNKLPTPGEMVFFDRSWYNRAILEPVNDFCSEEEYHTFMNHVNLFEKMLVESDTYLIKFYFSISKKEQARRLKEIKDNPLKRWKLSKIDEKAIELWDKYTHYKNEMFEKTNTDHAKWHIIKADKKTKARVDAINIILDTIPYTKR